VHCQWQPAGASVPPQQAAALWTDWGLLVPAPGRFIGPSLRSARFSRQRPCGLGHIYPTPGVWQCLCHWQRPECPKSSHWAAGLPRATSMRNPCAYLAQPYSVTLVPLRFHCPFVGLSVSHKTETGDLNSFCEGRHYGAGGAVGPWIIYYVALPPCPLWKAATP
jgi:hypothetical protein